LCFSSLNNVFPVCFTLFAWVHHPCRYQLLFFNIAVSKLA
jgi:hypothetical protein